MRYQEFNKPATCSECGGPSFSNLILAEKQDACYHKVKSRYKVWPSAYASGALVQCRKKGAKNWGNKSKNESVAEGLDQARVSPKTLQVVQQLRKQLSTPTALQAKKTMLVIKSDQLGPQDRKLIQDTLTQAGIPFKIKDNQVQSVRGSWTNTLVGIPYDQPGVAEGK